MKKRIGISFSKTNFEYYWNWFAERKLQDDIEPVELSFVKNNVDDISSCDGFVLTGGIDIDPSLYNGNNVYNKRPDVFQTERDHFEEKIFRCAEENKLPLLGICRGFQMVNVLLGGKLIQDLGTSGNKIHCKEESDKEHEVTIEKNTLLYDIAGQDHGKVNSAHHQAIDKLGNGLKINSRSEDGVIEGFEWEDRSRKPFLLCIQWHPERMFRLQLENSPLSKNIRSRFVDEIKKI
ncbi:MAG TPA: gamma-glutamyl-gamma-aminobutyrate hydrolase family protein [Puia sp.]|nr:gamma-glutamyl-gamma-aminobutyrate hydrolase family protein [Puia sp.]